VQTSKDHINMGIIYVFQIGSKTYAGQTHRIKNEKEPNPIIRLKEHYKALMNGKGNRKCKAEFQKLNEKPTFQEFYDQVTFEVVHKSPLMSQAAFRLKITRIEQYAIDTYGHLNVNKTAGASFDPELRRAGSGLFVF